MLACSLWVEAASLLWSVSDHSLCLRVALRDAFNKATASWPAELNGDLVALGERGELGGLLLRQRTLLPWPASALGAGGVPELGQL